MSGVYFGLFVVAVFVVIRWVMMNDAGNHQGTIGILAMTARRIRRSRNTATKSRFRRSKESDT